MGSNTSTLLSTDTPLWSEHAIEIATPEYELLHSSASDAFEVIIPEYELLDIISMGGEKLDYVEFPYARSGSSVASNGSREIFIFGGVEVLSRRSYKYKNDTWVIRESEDSDLSFLQERNHKHTKLTVSLVETTGEAPSPRMGHQSVVANGRLLIWGGHSNKSIDDSLYSLHIATCHWTKLDIRPAPSVRIRHAVCLCGSRLVVFGGKRGLREVLNDLWSLDIHLLEQGCPKWERIVVAPGSPFPSPRMCPAMVAYGNQLYIVGGSDVHVYTRTPEELTDMWRFDMTTRVWTKIIFPEKVPAHMSPTVQLVGDTIYVFGGQSKSPISWVYKIPERKWYRFPKQQYRPSARYGPVISTIGERVYLESGLENRRDFVSSGTVHGLNTDLIDFPEGGSEIAIKPAPTAPRLAQDSTTPITLDTITGAMSATEILRHLVAHGCRDISTELNVSRVSEYPVSQGGSGDVYIATLCTGDRVGLKCMRMLVGSTDEGRKFLKHAAHELYVWSKCRHPCILELFGVAIFRDQIAMVSPWVENGHLGWFLSQNPQANRCELCIRIADGVDYLHKNGTVHGDLKPENILVGKDHTPKLTDFGNAVLSEYTLKFTHSDTSSSMTMRWTAPEILSEETKTTQAGDVYALGMVIFETITGIMPYDGVKDVVIMRRVLSGIVPSRSETHIPNGVEQADRLWSLITRCWSFGPLERPKAWEVKEAMEGVTPDGLLTNSSYSELEEKERSEV